jgi:hypothetical protein
MKKITSLLFLAILTISCLSEKEKQLNEKSQLIFNESFEKIKKSNFNINIDSFRVVYEKHKSENPQTGLDFANSFEEYSIKLILKREEIEQADYVRESQRRQRQVEKEEETRSLGK